jgi:aerobic-type carbon monoxide dehydrogenase small subunit (CoxS/CutS family)/CO/xanthine dehydrogenase FAD-binding subunit
MLARGIRSYHRPSRIEEALSLAAQGAMPLAGGTRLLGRPLSLPNVLDLSALDLTGIALEDGDLLLGAMVTLQDVIDARVAYEATGGLLPAACQLQSASRMLRGMATVGGESVHGAADSEVVAALLALNAVFMVSHAQEPRESPALRFLRQPADDLGGGGLLTRILIPGAPDGAALERAAPIPSAPPIVAVAVTVALSGEKCSRARIALTGLMGRPARQLEAEALIERTTAGEDALLRAADQLAAHARFRDDDRASAGYRRKAAHALSLRALRRAFRQARERPSLDIPRLRPALPQRPPLSLPYFTSGRIELSVNGRPLRAEGEARTTLLELLRREGFRGAKDACEDGSCGACAVLLDGRPVNSCILLALRAQGRSVQTVEGLGSPDADRSVPAAFVGAGAFQCGYCTPAMEVCTKALLESIPDPTEDEARDALAGCLCRCTGYAKPVEAVLEAAAQRRVIS